MFKFPFSLRQIVLKVPRKREHCQCFYGPHQLIEQILLLQSALDNLHPITGGILLFLYWLLDPVAVMRSTVAYRATWLTCMLHPVNAILLSDDALNLSRCLVYILYSQLGKNEIVHSTLMPYSPVKHNDISKTMPSLWQGRLHLLYVVTDRDHVCVKKRQRFPTLLLRALQ